MSESVINNTVLDYSTVKYFAVPYSKTVKFYTGFLFPNNKNLVSAIWNFGDGTIEESSFSSNEFRYINAINALSGSVDFFPRWAPSVRTGLCVVIPKFEIDHTYSNFGTYDVSVTLVDEDGVSYIGKSTQVSVIQEIKQYNIPNNWEVISNQYQTSTDINFLAKNGIPVVTNQTSSTATIPIDVNFTISNLNNRVDVDYIEWNFGDGTVDVKTILGSPTISILTQNNYSYKLIPTQLVYEPQVIVYFKNKTKFKLQVPQIPVIDITNISVGINSTGNNVVNSTPLFNITPILSDKLPIEANFIHRITNKLKYIIWNYDDGVYDVVPVSYTTSISNILQTYASTHLYTSVNFYNYIPKCILLFENSDGTFTAEQYRSKKYLNYQLGIVNPQDNYFVVPITSTTNYKKFDNISSLVVYPDTNTGSASLYLRLSLDTPKQILFFEKIVWNVNGQTFIQDKNTSKDFGTIKIDSIATSTNIDEPTIISASLYGIPAIFANDIGNNALTFYDTYESIEYILDKDIQEAINANSKIELAIPAPEQPTLIQTDDGVIIVTSITDTELEVVVEEAPVYIGSNLIFENLFKAVNPSGNFLNRLYPSTASTPSDLLVTKRVIGFFRPSKTSPVVVDPGIFTFSLNLDSIEYNKPYYFPDPYKYGSNTTAINFFSLDQSFKKNARFGKARNEPNQPADSISYYGYNSGKTTNTLSKIFDQGYIHSEKKDLFGNVYGLVKDNYNFRQNIKLTELDTLLTLQLNGYKFYDDIFGEATTFNYTLTGTLGEETIRSGLSSYTNGFSARPSSFYLLNFGDFNRNTTYAVGKEVTDINTQYLNPINPAVRDGAYFTLTDTELLADSISSDLSTFPGTGSYYYETLFEAGVRQATPYIRPYRATTYPAFSAIFTQNVRVSASNGVIDVDGGRFETVFNINDDYFSTTGITYIDSVNPTSVTAFISSLSANNDAKTVRDSLTGTILIKDVTGNVDTIYNTLNYLQSKYTPAVYSSLTGGVINFDFIYNTYIIQTQSYLICDKINFTESGYINPKTANIAISYSNNLFNTISNRFKVNNFVYFATLSSYGEVNTSQAMIYPIVYKLDVNALEIQQVFPNTSSIQDYSTDFTVNTDGVLFTEASSPVITYSSDIELFNISYMLKDQNKVPYLMSVNFRDKQSNVIDSTNGFNFGSDNITSLFNTTNSISSFTTLLSSGSYSITTQLIL